MNRRIRTRLIIIFVLAAVSGYLFSGFPPSLSTMKERIHLGLDLNGGIRLVLQVITDDAIRAETDRAIESVQTLLQKQNIVARRLSRKDNDTVVVIGVDPAKDAE